MSIQASYNEWEEGTGRTQTHVEHTSPHLDPLVREYLPISKQMAFEAALRAPSGTSHRALQDAALRGLARAANHHQGDKDSFEVCARQHILEALYELPTATSNPLRHRDRFGSL